jgi:hypothetical protein
LITFWAPKPKPIASAPPMKANAVSGMRASLSVSSTTATSRIEPTQRVSTRAIGGDMGTLRPTPAISSRASQPEAQ